MNRRHALLALVVGAVTAVAAPAAHAHGRDCDCRECDRRYRSGGYYRRDRHRSVLYGRMDALAQRIRLAERERAITRRQAEDLYDELDDVHDFLRNDRDLTESEFDRRMDDLDDVEEDLRRHGGSRGGRYYRRYDRGYYDRQYSNYDRYPSRDYRYRRGGRY
ncbi:MAG: hypothetical protein ACK47B_07610 [Armatimonadota bacterium]